MKKTKLLELLLEQVIRLNQNLEHLRGVDVQDIPSRAEDILASIKSQHQQTPTTRLKDLLNNLKKGK